MQGGGNTYGKRSNRTVTSSTSWCNAPQSVRGCQILSEVIEKGKGARRAADGCLLHGLQQQQPDASHSWLSAWL
jgi:hypothetical protein